MKAVIAVVRKMVRAPWCMGHDPTNPKAFDSAQLFDARRLLIAQIAPELPTPEKPSVCLQSEAAR
jgi:hypothetical protein